jgi:hypothetical protein
MIQRADDDPVDVGRIMGSPGHGEWMKMAGDNAGPLKFYNAKEWQIAVHPARRPGAEMSVGGGSASKLAGDVALQKWPRSGQGTFFEISAHHSKFVISPSQVPETGLEHALGGVFANKTHFWQGQSLSGS